MSEETTCYRHPDRPYSVGCQRCDRPICASCMVPASVGFHCPECTKSGAQKVYRASDITARDRFTKAVMAIIAVVFLAQAVSGAGNGFTGGEVYREGVLFGPFVADGELWRIITGGFLHANLLHIAFNGYALWIFGRVVERELGSLRAALVYAGGLLGGSAAVLLFDFAVPTLGASGAVLGLAGGLAAVLRSRGGSIMQSSLAGLLLINLALPLIVGGISFWGHAGGIAGGFLAGTAVTWGAARDLAGRRSPAGPVAVSTRPSAAVSQSVLAGSVVVVALGVLAVVAGVVIQGIG